jgi:hypothetical protein
MSYSPNSNQSQGSYTDADSSIPNVVNNSLSSCPSPVQENDSLNTVMNTLMNSYANNVAQVLEQLNIPTCSTSESQGAGCVVTGGGTIFSSSSNTCSNLNVTTSIGCEAVTVQAALNAQLQENLNCTLSSLVLSSENYLSQQNTFNLVFSNSTINGDLDINNTQTNVSSANVINFANSDVQSAISLSASLSANTVASSFSNITSVGNSKSQDQLAMQDAVQSLNSLVSDNTIGQIALNSLNNVLQMNDSNETITGVVVNGNADITAVQQNFNTYVINNIANSIVSAVNDSNVTTALQSDLANYQTQNLTGSMGVSAIIPKKSNQLPIWAWILIGIGAPIVLGLIIWGLYYYYRNYYIKKLVVNEASEISSTVSPIISNMVQKAPHEHLVLPPTQSGLNMDSPELHSNIYEHRTYQRQPSVRQSPSVSHHQSRQSVRQSPSVSHHQSRQSVSQLPSVGHH